MDVTEAVALAECIADEVLEDFRQGALSRDRLTARIVALLLKHPMRQGETRPAPRP